MLQKRVAAELKRDEAEPDVASLSLPEVPLMMRRRTDYGRKQDPESLYKRQTYEAFALEVEWRNGHRHIDKSIVDRAFQYAAKQLSDVPDKVVFRMLARVSPSWRSLWTGLLTPFIAVCWKRVRRVLGGSNVEIEHLGWGRVSNSRNERMSVLIACLQGRTAPA